ncbi:MAG: choice-of-anchor J domain-containing protein [Prevotella sp.]|nr:choice-of-anchor J domain-containing protein [Prevotella sp.]
MSKRFASFLVGGLAAVLLGAPVQAQTLRAKADVQHQATRVLTSLSAIDPVTGRTLQQQDENRTKIEEQKELEAHGLRVAAQTTSLVPTNIGGIYKDAFAAQRSVNNIPVNVPHYAAAPTQDGNGIITSPDAGEHKFYQRSGTAYYASNQQIYYTDQQGVVEIVESADGVVYIKDIISRGSLGTWVKGTKSGNTISVPVGQPVAYNSQYATTVSVYWGNYDGNTEAGWNKESDATIDFTIDGDVITLQGSNPDKYIGIFWDDDNSFYGLGDYSTVWTYDPTYVPASTELVTPPADLTTETWKVTATQLTSNGSQAYSAKAQVGFAGNDVYVKGLFTAFPDAWVKGTISGDVASFQSLQFLGVYNGQYNIWLAGCNPEVIDGVTYGDIAPSLDFTYDAAAKTLTALNDALANAAEDRVYYLVWLQDLFINGNSEETVAVTGAPVDQLPYVNSFNTPAEQAEFGIINSNEDDITWTFVADGDNNTAVRYGYSNTEGGDDWLISPAIKLEKGKSYRVAFDGRAYSANYPERFEVKLGQAAKASAMTQTLIPSTDVVNATYETFENEAFTVEESGYYHVGIHVISDVYMWYFLVDNFVVEDGLLSSAPAAVTDLTVKNQGGDELAAIVSFTAPSTSLSGEALTENLKVELYRDDQLIQTFEDVTPGQAIVFVDTQENGVTLGTHAYQVLAYNATGAGKKSDVVKELIVANFYAPVTFDLTQQDIFNLFTVNDNNGDGATWNYSSTGTFYRYSGSNSGDDDLITPAVSLLGGRSYHIIVTAKNNGATYPERFEVLAIGADGQRTVIIPATDLTSGNYEDYEADFVAPQDGKFSLDIHAISDPDQYYLYVSTITIEAGLLPTSPSAPRLAVQPDPYGAPKAVVTTTASWKDISGNDLTANLSRLEILRDGAVVKTFTNVIPSETKVFVDYAVTGEHVYQARPYDENGDLAQSSAKVKVYVGEDVPVNVEQLDLADNGTSIDFSWDAVKTGVNGGYVDPTQVVYNLWTLAVQDNNLVLDEQFAALKGETSYQAPFVTDEGTQEFKYFGIIAENGLGSSAATVGNLLVGAPYDLPVQETFEGNSLHYLWTYGSNTNLFISNQASDEDGVALMIIREAEDGLPAEFTTGKLNVNGAGNPTLLFDVFTGSADAKLTIAGSVNGGKKKTLAADVPLTDEYTTVKVPLSQLKGGRYAQVSFLATLPKLSESYLDWSTFQTVYEFGDTVIIDNIRITDLYEYNLAAKVSAPKTVQAGEQAQVKVTVQNIGENAARNYTVKLFAGKQQLLNQTVAEELGSFKKKEFVADLATSIFDDPADITLRAEVEYDYDLDDEDNTAETVISIKQSSAGAPENVKGEVVAEGVKLTWNAPSSAVQEVTDDVESYEDFENGGLDANVHIGQIGEWTTYDGNGGIYAYGFDGIESTLGNPGAWQVFNPGALSADLAASYGAHSGNKYFISSCVAEPEGNIADTDNWLISPALPGTAQTITFWVRELVADYGAEKYQVLYSTTDNKVESFQVLATTQTTATEWEQVSFDLPAGTTYFAIRHISNDVWGLLVDDITYTVGGGDVAQYNIWVDGETADQVPASQTTYTVAGGKATSAYAVSAVYSNGKQSRPVVAVISNANQQPTGIETITGTREPADVYTLDGKLVRSQVTDLSGLKGAYVINGQKVILK